MTASRTWWFLETFECLLEYTGAAYKGVAEDGVGMGGSKPPSI